MALSLNSSLIKSVNWGRTFPFPTCFLTALRRSLYTLASTEPINSSSTPEKNQEKIKKRKKLMDTPRTNFYPNETRTFSYIPSKIKFFIYEFRNRRIKVRVTTQKKELNVQLDLEKKKKLQRIF